MLAAAVPTHAHRAQAQHDRGFRGVRQHIACLGAAASSARLSVVSAGASGSVLVLLAPSPKHSGCSHRLPRSAPHMLPPTPAEHMQCELRKSALNSSERHFRHAIQPREHLRTTCCQPPCCSRCSLLAAAIPSHAHHAPSGALSEDVLGGPHRCTASMGSE